MANVLASDRPTAWSFGRPRPATGQQASLSWTPPPDRRFDAARHGVPRFHGNATTLMQPRSHRLAFATSAGLPSIQPDDAHLAQVLDDLGLHPVSCVWNDPSVDWSTFDAVLIRTIWDYFQYYPAFLAWLDRLDELGIRTINDSALLRWNSDKRYLLDLAEHGAAVIPSRFADADELDGVMAAMRGQQVVIKPTVSGGAWHTLCGVAGDATLTSAMAGLPAERGYLVQPFVAEIVSAGEWSLVYVGGSYSHAVLKHPSAGDYRVQEEHGGTVTLIEPDSTIRAAAARVLEAVAALGHGKHAYARIDGVASAGQFLMMELELLEPCLFLAGFPAAAERLALHIAGLLKA
ncbi:MAG: hypothetical protein ABI379_12080 [Rhodanobacter sp.]